MDYGILIAWISLFLITHNVLCIHITDLEVDTMTAGRSGWLKCHWKGHDLYGIGWYLGNKQFYRYLPSAEKPVLAFNENIKGDFIVDQRRSFEGQVFVKNMSLGASGKLLKCEVSGERPEFITDHRVATLRVYDLPDEKPLIKGYSGTYGIDRDVSLTCISRRSKPAAKLSFYINDKKVTIHRNWLTTEEPLLEEETGLLTSVLRIRFPLLLNLVESGRVAVKCVSEIKEAGYFDSTVKYIYPSEDLIGGQRASRRGVDIREVSSGSSHLHSFKSLHVLYLVVALSLLLSMNPRI